MGVFGFLNLSLVDILDVLLVAVIIFCIFRWIRGSSAMNVLIAIVLLFIVRLVVEALGMKMMTSLMGAVIDIGFLALIILFQPEIRHFLFKFGGRSSFTRKTRSLIDKMFGLEEDKLASSSVRELVEACMEMSEQKVGALIVITKKDSLDQIIETGDKIDADISKRLIENIFFKNSPLHDGAMVLGGDRIVAARCTLPITGRSDVPAHFGMRHKAAIGITEECDAHVVVVSEENGRVSYVKNGQIQAVTGSSNLFSLLSNTAADTSETQNKQM